MPPGVIYIRIEGVIKQQAHNYVIDASCMRTVQQQIYNHRGESALDQAEVNDQVSLRYILCRNLRIRWVGGKSAAIFLMKVPAEDVFDNLLPHAALVQKPL